MTGKTNTVFTPKLNDVENALVRTYLVGVLQLVWQRLAMEIGPQRRSEIERLRLDFISSVKRGQLTTLAGNADTALAMQAAYDLVKSALIPVETGPSDL